VNKGRCTQESKEETDFSPRPPSRTGVLLFISFSPSPDAAHSGRSTNLTAAQTPPTYLDLFEQVRDVLVVKRQAPAQQRIQDHATAPHVHLGARVQAARDDLGRSIVGAPAAGLEEVAVAHHVAQAEVGDLDVALGVEEEVLGLQVAVHDHVAVAVLHAADDLGGGVNRRFWRLLKASRNRGQRITYVEV
jgi:hypothetical protein